MCDRPNADGWNVSLKPAFEPIVVGRKPLAGTVAANVLAWGTGALNIGACRVGTNGEVVSTPQSNPDNRDPSSYAVLTDRERFQQMQRESIERTNTLGRWPTNVILDESQAAELDRQSGSSPASSRVAQRDFVSKTGDVLGDRKGEQEGARRGYADVGGASRFFPTFRYEAKAPTSERPTYTQKGAGTGRVTGLGGKVRQCNVCETRAIESGATEPSCGHGDFRWEEPTTDTASRVAHPTVKPLDLMRWLVRLVTPPGGLVLDPFAGSGTTAEVCVVEGFRCVLIEREADYLPLIVQRLTKPIAPVLDFGASA